MPEYLHSIRSLLDELPGPDQECREAVRDRSQQVLRPSGALARLDEVAIWLAGWQRTKTPAVEHPLLLLAAADHGVVAQGVSAYSGGVTASMAAAIETGVATSTVIARVVGAEVRLIDAGVGRPTGNIAVEPAMSEARFVELFQMGRAALEGTWDLIVLGEMGIGNTTAASAVAASLGGGSVERWIGQGTGLDEDGVKRKQEVVRRALARAGKVDPLEALRQLGGSELVVLAGACVESRRRSIPVILDGFVVTSALAPLELTRPGALDHCLSGHLSPEPGHQLLLDLLGKRPLIDLGLRLGEGTGALAALPLVRLAAAAVVAVATFEEWGLT